MKDAAEPMAVTRFVIDASAVGPVLLPDEAHLLSEQSARLIQGAELVAPAHWPFEVANMLLVAQRRSRITTDALGRAFASLRGMEVEINDMSTRSAWTATFDLAVSQGLTLYDAAYLELAQREGCGLLTLDGALASAARARGVAVPLTS